MAAYSNTSGGWGSADSWGPTGGDGGDGHQFKPVAQDDFGSAADAEQFGHNNDDRDRDDHTGDGNDKCFGCGESGHRRAECPNAEAMTCHTCKQPGHMSRDCPDKENIPCRNCGEPGHHQRDCTSARKINRDHVADVSAEAAWDKMKLAARERDADDAKEAVQEYVKALEGEATYRQIQQGLIDENVNIWLIAVERQLLPTFTNMDLQGNMEKKYTVSYRFSDKPERPREMEGWPQSVEEILSRLDDAGEVVNNGKSVCHNCKEVGHVSKNCPEEKTEPENGPRVTCSNCNEAGHRVRDCPIPRIDKFACKNCGESGHKVADCPEPPNPANMECRKCSERSKVQCSQCKEYGHTKVRCKQLPVDDYGAVDNESQSHEPAVDDHAGTDAWGASTGQSSDPW